MSVEPIRIPCEGSGCPGHGVGLSPGALPGQGAVSLTTCAMCGRAVEAYWRNDGRWVALPHQRDDVLAMLDRGDFG